MEIGKPVRKAFTIPGLRRSKYVLVWAIAVIYVVGAATYALTAVPAKDSQVRAQVACEWPTVHHNAARSGHSPCEARPPFSEVWTKTWEGEMMSTATEAIVANGKVFVGSYAGRMHALDAATGDEAWVFTADSAIAYSPAVADGTLVFGTVDGMLYGLNTDNGSVQWTFSARGPGGFLASPTLYGGKAYIGAQDGYFYAVRLSNGTQVWAYEVGAMTLQTAAAADGAIYFGAENMYAYALDADTGAVIWRSDKLYGMSMRDYFPVVAGDAVIFRTLPPTDFKEDDLEMDGRFLESFSGTPQQEQAAIVDRLNANPHLKSFYVLDAGTGTEQFVAPVLYGPAGNGGLPPVPVVMGDGRVVTYYRADDSVWELGTTPRHSNFAIGVLDMSTGRIQQIHHNAGSTNNAWGTGWWCIGDESAVLSAGGDVVYNTHQGQPSGVDVNTGAIFRLPGMRDTWGGHVRPTWAGNEWHGPARGSVSIVDGWFYWVVGSRVIAVRGQ